MEKVRSDIFVYALLNTIFAFLFARWNFLCPFSAPYLFFFYFFHSLTLFMLFPRIESYVYVRWALFVLSRWFSIHFFMCISLFVYVNVCVCLLTLGFSCLNECCIKREKCSKPFSLFVCICFDLVLTWLVKSKGERKRKTLANGSDA